MNVISTILTTVGDFVKLYWQGLIALAALVWTITESVLRIRETKQSKIIKERNAFLITIKEGQLAWTDVYALFTEVHARINSLDSLKSKCSPDDLKLLELVNGDQAEDMLQRIQDSRRRYTTLYEMTLKQPHKQLCAASDLEFFNGSLSTNLMDAKSLKERLIEITKILDKVRSDDKDLNKLNFINMLKALRIDQKITIVELSAEMGMSQKRILDIEKGRVEPTLEELENMECFINNKFKTED